jgi:hypothetical protein
LKVDRQYCSGGTSSQVDPKRSQVWSAGVTSEPELKLVAGHGLLDRIAMAVKLVANGCPDEIGSVGVEPFLHEKIDLTQVNITEVDRYLLTIARFKSKLADIAHLNAISITSSRMVIGGG